jgi:hypothetical protein
VVLHQVEANWRSWLITHDASWRSLAFQRAAASSFPIANLPTDWGPAFVQAMKNAANGGEGYTAGDAANAKSTLDRLEKVDPLMIIASIKAVPHDVYLSTLAPADEYFGPMGMSILGMRNELHRINLYLDYGYGDRESDAAVQLAVAVDDLHKVYPRDRDLPQMLLDTYDLLARLTTKDAQSSRAHLRSILTVEYQDSPQAQKLLAS